MHAEIEGKGSLNERLGYAKREQDWIVRLLIFA